MKLKNTLLIFIIVCFTKVSFAQNETVKTKSEFWENVQFGGGLGLSIGDGFFSATLAPSGIYNVNEYFSVGLGLNGTIANRKNFYKSTILGGSLITLFNPLKEVQLSAEFEELNVNRNWDNDAIQDENYWYPALFLGAGYRSRNITFGIRYDVLYDEDKSIYANAWMPFVRFYF